MRLSVQNAAGSIKASITEDMSNPSVDTDHLVAMLRITGCPREITYQGRHMESLGQGFQYTAYGDKTLVYKVSLSVDQVCDKFRATWGGGSPDRERVAHDREAGLAVVRETRDRLESGQLPKALIADANIDEQLNYEQSRVTPLRKVFGQSSLEEQKHLVDRYVECVKTLIKHGTYETGFALLDNFGLNSRGQTVLLDFGELSFVKEVALDSASKQPWANDRGGVKVLEGEVLDYYLSRMRAEITPEFVDRE